MRCPARELKPYQNHLIYTKQKQSGSRHDNGAFFSPAEDLALICFIAIWLLLFTPVISPAFPHPSRHTLWQNGWWKQFSPFRHNQLNNISVTHTGATLKNQTHKELKVWEKKATHYLKYFQKKVGLRSISESIKGYPLGIVYPFHVPPSPVAQHLC